MPKPNTSSQTGALMAFGCTGMLFLAIAALIGAARMGHPPFVTVVDHKYDPVAAAELNKGNCKTYTARNDGAYVEVNCQTSWSPSYFYNLPQ